MAMQGKQTQGYSTQNAAEFGDANRLVAANRIHVYGGSLFLDPYLAVHPRELRPENQAALRNKLQLTFGLNNPSFYESPKRLPVALNLASLLPISLQAKRSSLMSAIEKFNTETLTNADADLAQFAKERAHPFAAIVEDTIGRPASDPVGMEALSSGLTFYLLLREALTRKGYLDRLTDYVNHDGNADQILTALQDKLGVSSETVMEAARTGGITGIAAVLRLDATYLKEVQEVVARAATQEFSYNTIEHWHMGRQLLAANPAATIDDKISVGMERRISDTMSQLKAKTHGKTDVPADIAKKEQWVADGLKLLPPIQRQLLWDLKYEIGYTDDSTADKIAFHPHIYGLHRQTKNQMTDVNGTYRIYFAGKGDIEGSRRTLVHEVSHNLWPAEFSAQEIADVDALANRDRMRLKSITTLLETQFDKFKSFVDAYHSSGATAQSRAQVLADANAQFGSTLGDVSRVIAENKDAYEVLHMTQHCNDRLHIDGKLYKQSGYNDPESRFREVVSRYAEMRYVRLREQPALMEFIAPSLGKVYDNYYLPHLERLHEKLTAGMLGQNNPRIAAETAANDNMVQTPMAATGTTGVNASSAELPSKHVHTAGLELDGRNVAAMQTLADMGVHVSKLGQSGGQDAARVL